jgi:hypothetical protein
LRLLPLNIVINELVIEVGFCPILPKRIDLKQPIGDVDTLQGGIVPVALLVLSISYQAGDFIGSIQASMLIILKPVA